MPRFTRIAAESLEPFSLYRHENGAYYVGLFDRVRTQVLRRSLGTSDLVAALERVVAIKQLGGEAFLAARADLLSRPLQIFSRRAEHGRCVLDVDETGCFHIGLVDPASGEVTRRSLETTDFFLATDRLSVVVNSGISDDLDAALALDTPLSTIRQLLAWHRTYASTLTSHDQEGIAISAILATSIADRRIATLTRADFEGIADQWRADGLAVGTVSRRLSTLRSALNRAAEIRRLPCIPPKVPEFRTRQAIRSAPPLAVPIDIDGFAALWDAVEEEHLRLYLALLLATAARPEAIFDLTGTSFDLDWGLVGLNPPGRLQTNKWRPTLPIIPGLAPWVRHFPKGPLLVWHGRPVRSVRTALRHAIARAGLPPGYASYSIRHGLGRHMRRHRVPTEEISLYLGHVRPPDNPLTTLVYSPWEADYLSNAVDAVQAFWDAASAKSRTGLAPGPLDLAYLEFLRNREGNA